MAGPGFFVPALRVAFYPAGKCGVNGLEKLLGGIIAEAETYKQLV
jgi:hypothetical protein